MPTEVPNASGWTTDSFVPYHPGATVGTATVIRGAFKFTGTVNLDDEPSKQVFWQQASEAEAQAAADASVPSAEVAQALLKEAPQ